MLLKPVTIRQVHEEITGFKTITFEEGHGIHYKAGQYLTFLHQHQGTELRRSYSITSSPFLNEPLTIGVRRIENGAFSRLLIDHAKKGDQLLTTGAGGFFTLPDDTSSLKQVCFFAAGSGITPVYSLLKTLLHQYPSIKLLLVYSNPSRIKTVFYQPLKDLEEQFPHQLTIHFLYSNIPDLRMARLNRDLLLSLVQEYRMKDHEDKQFYICGPEAYMRMVTYTLQEVGIPSDRIRRENFNIDKRPSVQPAPPDTHTYTARIRYDDRDYVVEVRSPDSILRAARSAGILLPYSCEAGRCGNCVALCEKGKVWMSYNEVLTDSDLKKGLILTCVAHPVDGDVTLKI